MLDFELPTKKEPPLRINPKTLCIYGMHKIGKTEILSQLPEPYLIADFEVGTEEKTATRVKIIGLLGPTSETVEQKAARYSRKEYYLDEVLRKLEKHNPYKFVAIDTTTRFEDMCIFDATKAYMRSPIGKNFNRWDDEDEKAGRGKEGVVKPRDKWQSVLDLPKGAGWGWVRNSYESYITRLQDVMKPDQYLILCAHVKVSNIAGKTEKTDTEVNVKDLNLTGKIKEMTSQIFSDSIGYIYREGVKNFIDFTPTDEIKCGSRSKHLANQKILISEQLEDGTIKVYWENIYK